MSDVLMGWDSETERVPVGPFVNEYIMGHSVDVMNPTPCLDLTQTLHMNIFCSSGRVWGGGV